MLYKTKKVMMNSEGGRARFLEFIDINWKLIVNIELLKLLSEEELAQS